MPGQGKYGTVYSNLATKKPVLEKLFANSPLYDGSYTHEALLAIAAKFLTPDVQVGDLALYPAVDMNYSLAPDLASVKTGGGGLPSTPYTPNVASPGPAAAGDGTTNTTVINVNVDPTKVPDAGATPADFVPNFVPGENGTTSPATTAPAVAGTVLGKPLALGTSSK